MVEVTQTVSDTSRKKGGILESLRRSPLVGEDLEMDRPFTQGRESARFECVPRSESSGRDLGEPPTQG